MMPKREVIRTLLDKKIPDRFGLHEHFWPHIMDNAWIEQGVKEGTDFVKRFNLDLRSMLWCAAPGPRPDLEATLEETADTKVTRNAWGATFKNWNHKGGTPEHLGFAVTSPEVWRRDFREAAKAADMRRTVDLAEAKKQYAALMAGEEFVTFSGLSVFEEMRKIIGDVAMLEAMVDESEFIRDFCEVITGKHIEFWEYVLREVGKPDGFHIYEDLGYTQAPFTSPAMHRELVHPHHVRLFGFLKEHKVPLIVHTCGDFRPHIPALVEAGVDCIQAMEAKTGMNVVTLAETWKDKLCFMGNLDVRALESGDRARIRDEAVSKLDGMRRLRAPWIFMSDHSIPPTVAVKDYEYLLEVYKENNRY
ncbi:MAG: hypothetical protein J0L75_20840 [Spirochaetes bacterium]|nr:hypothetical protein [Spirochaetota bacterium]